MNLILLLSVVVLYLIELSFCEKLGRNVIPHHYKLSLEPDIDNASFVGNVSINLELKTSTNVIVLNSYGLQIDPKQTTLNGIKVSTIEQRGHHLRFTLNNEQPRGNYSLEILNYLGKLSADGVGWSRQKCTEDTEDCFLVINEFEPYEAHKAFPCFDEPSFKATFSISLTTPNETFKAYSNMPEKSSHKSCSGKIVYEFETTPVMSTYLVSLAVANFNSTSTFWEYQGRNVTISIHHWGDESYNKILKAIKYSLDFFTNYTNIPYPLPKLDFIEYDRSVGSLATENWGLITIRRGFLSDKSEYTHFQVSTIVIHEVGHSWFGNTVTNEDFNDLWLNEAINVYFAWKGISQYGNPMNLIKILSTSRASIMLNDSSVKSISIACREKSSIEACQNVMNHFSSITYDKGSILMYTFNKVVGEEKFQEIIRKYLLKFQYKNANTNDFITLAEEVSQMNLRPFLESYLYQNTVPLINVEKGDDGTYILTQRSSGVFQDLDYKWTIPVIYQTDKISKSEIIWFNASMEKLVVSVPNNTEWIKFNKEEIGFYYVNYSSCIWDNLINHIHEIKEARYLLNEASYLHYLGYLNCDVFFKVMQSIPSGQIWKRGMNLFIHDMMCNLGSQPANKEYMELLDFIKCHWKHRNDFPTDCDIFTDEPVRNRHSVQQCVDRMRNVKLKPCI